MKKEFARLPPFFSLFAKNAHIPRRKTFRRFGMSMDGVPQLIPSPPFKGGVII